MMDWESLIDENGHAVIPNGVTEISARAFKGIKSLTSIDIPETVTEIQSGAFEDCTWLESVKIHDGMESIGQGAFMNCSSLSSIEIPCSVKEIGEKAFAYCKYLKSIQISPDNINFRSENNCCLSKDGKFLIFGCSTSVIPDGVTSIEDSAFYGSKINEIKMPSSVKTIGDSAFCECEHLVKADLSPASVRHIGDNAFNGCKKLSYIYLPNSLQKVYKDTFQRCWNLEEIRISLGLVDICPDAFQSNTKLTKINVSSVGFAGAVPDGLIMIDGHPVYRNSYDAEFIHYHFPYANEVIRR